MASLFLLFSHYVVSNSLWPHGLQHTSLPCPSLSSRVCSNSCPMSQWCYLSMSSSVATFSFCLNLALTVGNKPASNAGDPGSIPGSGISAGEGIGYPLQYSWVSFVAQLVKNPPAVREIWVWSLGWEDPRRRERLPTPVFWPRELNGLYSPWGHKKSDMTDQLSLSSSESALRIRSIDFLAFSLLYGPTLTSIPNYWKNHSFDYMDLWVAKNWCFQIVVLEKTLENPLDSKEIKTSQSERKSTLNIHWKDWCWTWSSNTLATWCWK